MKCPTCGTMNEPGAAFCDQCGAALGAGAPAPVAPQPVPQPQVFPPPQPQAPAAGGVNCPSCGQANLPGTMFCDNCGASLSGAAPAPQPQPFPPQPQPFVPPQPQPFVPPQPQPFPPQPQPFSPSGVGGMPHAPARLMVGGQQVMVPQKAEAVIGRADLASAWNPDVDLTPFGGTPEAGVSRKHAKLVWQNAWMIEDLNSVNGTFLRGQRLAPGQRTPLNNGDVVQMGKLQVTFYAS